MPLGELSQFVAEELELLHGEGRGGRSSTSLAPEGAGGAPPPAAAAGPQRGSMPLVATGGGWKGLLATLRTPGAQRTRIVSTAVLTLAGFMEKAEEQVVPALFKHLSAAFRASPGTLGNLILCRALTQALCAPLASLAGEYMPRTTVVGAGCVMWGLFTICMGLSNSIATLMFVSLLNGVALSVVVPTVSSLLADFWPAEVRGRVFGTALLVGSFGGLLGGLYAATIGGRVLFATPGWRVALHTVGLVSIASGAAIRACATEPALKAEKSAEKSPLLKTLRILRSVLQVRTFQFIVLQGIVGSMPWSAMVFFTYWFELLGFPDSVAATLYAIYMVGGSLGMLLGGYLGDMMALRDPSGGRIYVAQVSVFSGIPLMFLIVHWVPTVATDGFPFGVALLMFVFGGSTTWCLSGCNSPIFTEIVPETHRSAIFAFDRSFEGAIGALAGPLVGLVADNVYGFSMELSEGGGGGAAEVSRAAMLRNSAALGKAIRVMTVLPWTLCFIFFSTLHWVYPADKARALECGSEAASGRRDRSNSVYTAVHASDPDLKALSIDVGREDARAGPPGQRAA